MKNKQIQIAVLRAYARAYMDLQSFDWARRQYEDITERHGLCHNSNMAANKYINRKDEKVTSCLYYVHFTINYATAKWADKTQNTDDFGYCCSYPIPLTAEQEAKGYSRGQVYGWTQNCYVGIPGFYRQSLAGFLANFLLAEALKLETEL